jgi:hypothetical protein
MRAALVGVGMAALVMGGCAATGSAARGSVSDFARRDVSGLRVVATRAVDAHVQPMVPVHLAPEGSNVAITFGQRGRQQRVTRLDPASLHLVSSETAGRAEAFAAPSAGPARVELEGGRFVVLWTQDNANGGRQAMAQMWTAAGSRLGEPLVISSPDADVFGAPSATTTDGHHVLVTFAATAGPSFELRAVSLEDNDDAGDSYRMARR